MDDATKKVVELAKRLRCGDEMYRKAGVLNPDMLVDAAAELERLAAEVERLRQVGPATKAVLHAMRCVVKDTEPGESVWFGGERFDECNTREEVLAFIAEQEKLLREKEAADA